MRLAGSLILMLCALAACRRPSASAHRAPVPRDSAAGDVHLAATPAALAPVFQALDSLLSSDQRSELRGMLPQESGRYHAALGMWIRNEFGLWAGGPLRDSLETLGLLHPDAMSDVVLKAYALYLRDEPIDLHTLARQARSAARLLAP